MKSPRYMETFKCIGGSCEDNCCIGWDVDIDKKTYYKYQKVNHPQMKREFDRYIRKNQDSYDDEIDYAFAMLDSNKHCSFLNADHLCMIHKHLGESYLSNVCASFPRIVNRISGRLELSATLSCPEIARRVLCDPSAMEMVDSPDPSSVSIVSYDVEEGDKRFKGKLPSKLTEIRDHCMLFFAGETPSLTTVNHKLAKLRGFITACNQLEKQNKVNQINELLEKKGHQIEGVITGKSETSAFLALSDSLIEHLRKVGAEDSPRYIALSDKASNGEYKIGRMKFDAFLSANPHVLTHYFQNHLFKNLFPFSEGKNIEEAALLLMSRYLIINRELCGLAASEGLFGMDEVVAYLQSFSKVIEHHKHFEEKTLQVLKAKGYKLEQMIRLIANQ